MSFSRERGDNYYHTELLLNYFWHIINMKQSQIYQFTSQLLLISIIVLLDFITASSQQNFNSPTAKYRVTFHATWNPVDHPVDFPSFDHFSGLIGMTHNQSAELFVEGQLASLGIIRMAELGAKSTLIDEISHYISNGTGKAVLSGGGLGTGTGMVSMDFEIDKTHSLVSITSMIAPSPDWFIGVHDVDLFGQGHWANELTVQVGVYDSGSDSGSSFSSPNQPSQPRQAIHSINTPPLAMNGVVPSMGTMVFERIDGVNECSDRELTFHDSPIQPNSYTTNKSILATGEVGQSTQVIFQAASSIILEDAFSVQMGGIFELIIAGCN